MYTTNGVAYVYRLFKEYIKQYKVVNKDDLFSALTLLLAFYGDMTVEMIAEETEKLLKEEK